MAENISDMIEGIVLLAIVCGMATQTLFAEDNRLPIKSVQMLLSDDPAEQERGEAQIVNERANIISQLTNIIPDPKNHLYRKPSVCKAMSILGELRATEGTKVLADNIAFPRLIHPEAEEEGGLDFDGGMANDSIESLSLLPAVKALINIGEPCIDDVIRKLSTADYPLEIKACKIVLGELDRPLAVREGLEKALEGDAQQNREQLLKMLGRGPVMPDELSNVSIGMTVEQLKKIRPVKPKLDTDGKPTGVLAETGMGMPYIDKALYSTRAGKLESAAFFIKVSGKDARKYCHKFLKRCIDQWGDDYRVAVNTVGDGPKEYLGVSLLWEKESANVIATYMPTLNIGSDEEIHTFMTRIMGKDVKIGEVLKIVRTTEAARKRLFADLAPFTIGDGPRLYVPSGVDGSPSGVEETEKKTFGRGPVSEKQN